MVINVERIQLITIHRILQTRGETSWCAIDLHPNKLANITRAKILSEFIKENDLVEN